MRSNTQTSIRTRAEGVRYGRREVTRSTRNLDAAASRVIRGLHALPAAYSNVVRQAAILTVTMVSDEAKLAMKQQWKTAIYRCHTQS